MAERITPRAHDFPQWYQDVVIQAKLADYSPVKGCMVIRPAGYSIWERIQRELDARIRETGVQNAYFPLFIPESFLKKEAEHVEGFAPQCAVVTYAGAKDLDEKLVVRPTSETIINSMFAKWVQSYRDLPLLINQWANVVRWEMRTRLFLRTSEFLWQEGHTCHADEADAEARARQMLQIYAKFAEEILAVPVLAGLKSASEKFAGAVRTYSIEAMMQDRKALQAGTSHYLGTGFAKAFGTEYLDAGGKRQLVHQTSWGVSTRLVGALVMIHSDDKGLILPPRVAETQVVIVPVGPPAARARVLEAAEAMAARIRDALPVWARGPRSTLVDRDETKQAGWKFHEIELQGIPLRVELGPRDLDAGQAVVVRRDTGEKANVALGALTEWVVGVLPEMQRRLFERARAWRDESTHRLEGTGAYAELRARVEEPGGFYACAWCGSAECESKVKEETKATIRCLPLDANHETIADAGPCLACGKAGGTRAIFARNY